MMMVPQLLALSLALAPNLVSAALFPSDSLVKFIDAKQFRNKVLKENMTSIVAFVAPWCGHCQRMAPEYSRAALGLYPLVPLYAVDCDDQKNKKLCAEQGVAGFPTVKIWPRGKEIAPSTYDSGERTATAFYYWATRAIPAKVDKVAYFEDVNKWQKKNIDQPRALLMRKSNKHPLLWTVLGNKYNGQITMGSHRDRQGKDSVKLGFEAGPDGQGKVIVWPAGSETPMQFSGIMKFDSLVKFFDALLDGKDDLDMIKQANQDAAAEEFVPDPKEVEIEMKKEAEMLKLAHGGFADFIDFEAAVKDGSAKNFHGSNGYPGMMGEPPLTEEQKAKLAHGHMGGSEGGLHASSAAQGEASAPSSSLEADELPEGVNTRAKMPMTGDAGQVVFEGRKTKDKSGEHPKTGVVDDEAQPTEEASPTESPVEPAVEATPEPTSASEEHKKDEL